jgi:DNA-3-methyladenine glycosylase II
MAKSHAAARRHLTLKDPVMGELLTRIGPCRWKTTPDVEPYVALAESICYQQLTGKAAATIWNRLCALFGGTFPEPDKLLATPDEALRGAGLSRNKVAALRDLATHAQVGKVPTREKSVTMTDAELITELIAIRGIGRWTVEMFLIFTLGRPDVLPIHDYGVQKGFKVAYRKRKLPTPKQLEAFGKRWAPHRTVASWYLWRAADQENGGRA